MSNYKYCECCEKLKHDLEILTMLLCRDVAIKIIELEDDHHFLRETYKENIYKIEHYVDVSILNKSFPDTINIEYIYMRRRCTSYISLELKLLRNNEEIFKFETIHCDYEWYQAYNLNEFINMIIQRYNLKIICNDSDIIIDNIICIPNLD